MTLYNADDIPSDNGTADSPTSSGSSSDDAVNNPAARVYFGRLQSPEKKLAVKANRRRKLRTSFVQSPLRRSSRLSTVSVENRSASPLEQSSDEVEDDCGEGSNIRQGTPEREIDVHEEPEPPSVLVQKISRAHDHPSPPPRMPLFDDEQAHSPPPRLIDISGTFEGPLVANHNQSTLPEPPFSPFSSLNPTSGSKPPLPIPQNTTNLLDTSMPDLISFEPLLPFTPPRPGSSSTNATEDRDAQLVVDLLTPEGLTSSIYEHPQLDLLAPSPVRRSARLSILNRNSRTPSPAPSVSSVQPGSRLSEPEEGSDEIAMLSNSMPLDSVEQLGSKPAGNSPKATPVPLVTISSPSSHLCSFKSASPRSTRPSTRPRRSPRLSFDNAATTSLLSPPSTDSKHSPSNIDTHHGPPSSNKAQDVKGKRIATSKRRELSSLSPTSADVLSNILATGFEPRPESDRLSPSPASPILTDGIVTPSTPQRRLSPDSANQESRFIMSDVQRPPSGTPFRSPSKRYPSSPVKSSGTLNDPDRSPRRIPIAQAIAEGSLSLDKLPRHPSSNGLGAVSQSGTGLFGRPVFTRPNPNDPLRSPRRVPVSDKAAAPFPIRSGSTSPNRTSRAGSAEPQPLRKGLPTFKSSSKASSDSELPSTAKPRSALPFPIRGAAQRPGSKFPDAIPEEVEGQTPLPHVPAANAGPATGEAASPSRSGLRQPSNNSRIPRIGAKPYARPTESKLVLAARKASTNAAPSKPLRIVRTVTISSSSNSSEGPRPGEGKSLKMSTYSQPQMRGTSIATAPSILKRKRSPDQQVSSPPVVHPIMIRQVIPGVNGPKYASSSKVTSSPTPTASSSIPQPQPPQPRLQPEPNPSKKIRTTHMRKVEGLPRKAATMTNQELEPVDAPRPPPKQLAFAEPASDPSFDITVLPPFAEDTSAISRPLDEATGRSESNSRSSEPEQSPDPLALPIDASEAESSARRLTRSRKATPASDVFGAVRSLHPRRRPRQAQFDAGGFPAISATALKNLTTSNTVRNQQSVARLEKEIVRKDGKRPESPSTKVRTLIERQKEGKARERQERAKRRARRSGDGQSDGEGLEDLGDLSFSLEDSLVLGPDRKPLKHRMGAGDEVDYVTPDKGRNGKGAEGREAKRVKWDRGLFDTIYLDDIKPGAQGTSLKAVAVTQKGVLSATAKSLQLDSYGNLLADSPLKDLVPENITVKKFVYDDDVEAQEIPKPKTRSKRSKS